MCISRNNKIENTKKRLNSTEEEEKIDSGLISLTEATTETTATR